MADEKKFEKFKERSDTSLKSVSLANLVEQDAGMQSDNGSHAYYVTGYNPYDARTSMAVCPKANASAVASASSLKMKGLNSVEKSGPLSKVSSLPLDPKSNMSAVISNLPKSTPQSQPLKSSKEVPQLGSDFRSAGLAKGCYTVRKFSSLTNQVQGPLPRNGPMSYRPNGQTWAGQDRFRLGEKFNRNGNFETSREPNRGPRARRVCSSLSLSDEKNELGISVRRDKYNLPDFQTVYENAKFFVIKSYSEDDIHKSIKYSVWASTPNGNRKLDTAFHDAETRSRESGTRCPIFLFFSVNGSGQFLGLAEMIAPVDFKKDMDFWKQDKWNGFFPLKWRIIKDIPNGKLRHIILENNDNRPVTYSRDTQEIGLEQGLEMLTIFKSFPAITSMLDDYNFYEEQQKTPHARSNKAVYPQIEIYKNKFPNQLEGVRKTEQASIRANKRSDSETSMIKLTKNLSLNSHSPEANAGMYY